MFPLGISFLYALKYISFYILLIKEGGFYLKKLIIKIWFTKGLFRKISLNDFYFLSKKCCLEIESYTALISTGLFLTKTLLNFTVSSNINDQSLS